METEGLDEPTDINIEVPMPSVKEIREFRKQFEKQLNWRKRYRKQKINPFELKQEARILREMQELMNIKTDIHFSALVLDRRHYQSASVFERAALVDKPIETSNGLKSSLKTSNYSNRSNNFQSSFYDSSDSEESYKPKNSKHVKLQMPNLRRSLSPVKESFFKPSPNYKTRSYRF